MLPLSFLFPCLSVSHSLLFILYTAKAVAIICCRQPQHLVPPRCLHSCLLAASWCCIYALLYHYGAGRLALEKVLQKVDASHRMQ